MKLLNRTKSSLDERRLDELIIESKDLHSDAMRDSAAVLPDLRDLAADRRASGQLQPTEAELDSFNESRSALIRRLGMAAGGVFGFGALSNLLARPALAAGTLDVQMLQTAVSLELLAVATYDVALTLPFMANGNPVVAAFAKTTMEQHDEHRAAFSKQTLALGGVDQTAPNPKYTPIVEASKPTLKAPADVVMLAMVLEEVATETYLSFLNQFTDVPSRSLMASVMSVEAQHLAVLRAVNGLLLVDADLIKIPLGADVAKLPFVAGHLAFPASFQGISHASPADEGAVK